MISTIVEGNWVRRPLQFYITYKKNPRNHRVDIHEQHEKWSHYQHFAHLKLIRK